MPTINKPKRTYQRNAGNHYDAARRKIYQSPAWKFLRLHKFGESPLCEICEKEGRIVPAVDIHHKVSFMSTDVPARRYELAYDYDNLMSLCKQCHQRIHNEHK